LKRIGRRTLLLRPQLPAGGTGTGFADLGIGITTLMLVIPEDTHHPLVIALYFDRIKRLMSLSHRDVPKGAGRRGPHQVRASCSC
jgi:hypothetical protein